MVHKTLHGKLEIYQHEPHKFRHYLRPNGTDCRTNRKPSCVAFCECET